MTDTNNLTPCQREVFDLLGKGRSREEIAQTIYRSVSAIDYHLAEIKRKLGLRTTAQVIALAAKGMNF